MEPVYPSRFGGRIRVGDDEVDEQYESCAAIEQPRFLVSEILLNADTLTDQQRVARISQEIVTQLRNGADFSRGTPVQRHRQRARRAAGVGNARTIDPALGSVLTKMEPGQISTPIATNAGFYILLLQNREEGRARNALNNKFDIMTVTFPAETNADDIKKFVEISAPAAANESAGKSGWQKRAPA